MLIKMKKTQVTSYFIMLILIAGGLISCVRKPVTSCSKEIRINLTKSSLTVDGFGVNITPAQWNNGKLKPALDMLVDDLGAILFRFDCTGLANWLDPYKRNTDGSWPESYLDSVYKSKVFTDSWETFRYLNNKGIEPFFNVSGRIHPGLGKPDEPTRLADFEGYAEMVATMLKWAREKEGLKFSILAPFNETDLGYPEGPKIDGNDMLLATRAIIKRLDASNLGDIGLVAIDDASPKFDKLDAVLSDSSYSERIHAFATHTYGSNDMGQNLGWAGAKTDFTRFASQIKNSAFRNASVWMTEYGDLDQTGLIEYEFAWRSSRRLMKSLRDGFSAVLAWDAFDNFHEHDTAWAVYGLLKTDTVNWKYTPKKRYYAAKQVYRFVKPGWKMVEITTPQPKEFDVYKRWHDPFNHIRMLAFISPDGNDYTIVIMNGIESDTELSIYLENISKNSLSKSLNHWVTGKTENCTAEKVLLVKDNTLRAILPEHSISTFTTLK
jgi:O-glycosyl hydrolase